MLTVSHEVAHLLEKGGDHGPEWRSTYDQILQAVYEDAVSGAPGAFAHQAGCACCAAGGGLRSPGREEPREQCGESAHRME